ncbi:DUF2059 domain-containing protein [Frateuria aurantia]|uniref:DUF2059 domain-containing protein n=1 Tax=Frateuria aurantia (strain ATCC 33424 / DSM 6220 / KCTC 2777 / LMG 1558 / NBRC 3245 / NCIMB 13370) TaxID=767434 RepID=H8KYG1_FRAAD|nr:DUF2059 domain-containing protein [Frateuria aurantia]AFC86965.1 hypothetical protein Fraau_2622 [Frateuria aurantia DSM 6220]
MMDRWLKLTAGVAAAMAVQLSFAATPSEQQVRQLLQTIGLPQTLQQMNTQMALMMHQQEPCIPGSYWQNFVDGPSSEALIAKMVPIYQRHFTADDIAGLNRFYATDLGRKMLTVMPQALNEAAQVNQAWARQRTEQMQTQLQSEGKLAANGKCPGSEPPPIVPPLTPDTAASAAAPGAHRHAVSRRRLHHRRTSPVKSRKAVKASTHKPVTKTSHPVKSKPKPTATAATKTTSGN